MRIEEAMEWLNAHGRLEAEYIRRHIDELRTLIRDTPVLLLDIKACAARGEDEAVKYARDLVAWKKRVDEIQL